MATYVMTRDGGTAHRIVSGDPDVQTDLTDWMITLSNKKAGQFFLFFVEKSEYKGWETYTLIAVVENGVKLGCEKQVTCNAKFQSITPREWWRMIRKAQISKMEIEEEIEIHEENNEMNEEYEEEEEEEGGDKK